MCASSSARASRIIDRCREIAAFTEVPGETTRTFLAPSMHGVHALLREWMEALDMAVTIDAIGNLRGLYPASGSRLLVPRLVIGSHLDTVPNAGAFDGVLGVVLAVAVIEELRGVELPFAIEVVGFSEEEGVRFAKPFLGSLAFIGELENDAFARKDSDGITLEQAVRTFGLDLSMLPAAAVSHEALAYLEVHIEQGPVLESESLPLGVVSGIVGQTRLQLTFTGQSNHAGTTPMHLRHDAMAAAAAWIVAVEEHALATSGLVATTGRVSTRPGAANVIAGEVTATLDVRHADDAVRSAAVTTLTAVAVAKGKERGVEVSVQTIMEQNAVNTDAVLTLLLSAAAAKAGVAARKMVSGAGHDLMIVARRLPSALLFIRSPAGLSHHPGESVLVEDVEAALATTLEFIDQVALRGAPIRREENRAHSWSYT